MFHAWFYTWRNRSRRLLARESQDYTLLNNNKQANSEVQKPAFKLRTLLVLHRRMGVASALFVILLSLSGLVIHHSSRLSLDQKFIGSSSMLSWYGIEAPAITLSYRVDNHQASLIADSVYFDRQRLSGRFDSLIGLARTESAYLIATNDQLLLVTEEAELIEVLGSVHGLPRAMSAIGTASDGGIYLRNNEGVYAADIDALRWSLLAMPPAQVQWNTASEPSAEISEGISSDYRNSLLSWDRVILDIHSGRFFGYLGVVLVDVMALLFVLMGISGVWIWSRRRS